MRTWRGVVALLLCAAMTAGFESSDIPRIDPTGERVFVDPSSTACPPTIACPPPVDCPPQPPAAIPALPRAGNDLAITLSPRVTVAAVGSEVVLIAGVCGPDGYLRTNRRLEWSLDPGGVGQFVAVEENGLVDLLLGDFNRPRKITNTFAVGSTSRGNTA